jgi:hypothetical protein
LAIAAMSKSPGKCTGISITIVPEVDEYRVVT